MNIEFEKPQPLGVGIQYNPEILDWFDFEEVNVDFFEILLDNIMGPLDSPYILRPNIKPLIERLIKQYTLLAHSNYGCEFGFLPLENTPAVRRHAALAKMIDSPWVADHCFYGDDSWVDIWSSPVQFSTSEVDRIAHRAKQLQSIYGVPLAHENAAYYLPCAGAEMREAEFMARLVEKAGTFLHLDLHNIYTNSVNFPKFDLKDYLNTIPLDRVIAIHIAGGSWYGGVYHDWHDSNVPEPVWDLLEEVLSRTSICAVTLEYQGQAHNPDTRVLGTDDDKQRIIDDIERSFKTWKKYQPQVNNKGNTDECRTNMGSLAADFT